MRPASPVPAAKSSAAGSIAAPASRSTLAASRPPSPSATRAAAGTMPAAAPAATAAAADRRNLGRSSGRRPTGVPSSQSAVACGTVTGPRHSASRATASRSSSAAAASIPGAACSRRGAAAVGGGGCRSARYAAAMTEPP